MKNLIYVLTIACLFLTANLQAQTPMVKGNNYAMVGFGFGGYGHSISSSVSPTISASFQRGIMDNLGPGNLSVGGTMAFKTGKYDGYYTDTRWNYFALAARASYHPHFIKSEKIDLYGGLGLGYYRTGHKTQTVNDANIGATSASAVALTYHIGSRYNVNEKFSVWAELGNQLSFISGGGSYRF